MEGKGEGIKQRRVTTTKTDKHKQQYGDCQRERGRRNEEEWKGDINGDRRLDRSTTYR